MSMSWNSQGYLDESCSAYIEDVLVYTNGSVEQHREPVKKLS